VAFAPDTAHSSTAKTTHRRPPPARRMPISARTRPANSSAPNVWVGLVHSCIRSDEPSSNGLNAK